MHRGGLAAEVLHLLRQPHRTSHSTRWPLIAVCRPHIAAACASTAGPSDLLVWVTQQGGSVSPALSISRSDPSTGYGLTASRACEAGEKLVSLPRRLQLTYDDSSNATLLQLISRVPEELWGAKLALQVLRERVLGPDSRFEPYISNLPIGVPGIPIFFSPEAVRVLEQYPPLSEQVKKRCRWLLSFAGAELTPLSQSPAQADPFAGTHVDTNALGWALSATSSRAFRVRGPQHPAALLPLIDMANHSFAPNCEVLPGRRAEGASLPVTFKERAVEMVSLRAIEHGEDLLLSYGKLDNTLLLLDYGFIVPDNPHDTVLLRFSTGMFEAAQAMAGGQVAKTDKAVPLGSAAFQQQLLAELNLVGTQANMELAIGRSLHASAPRLLAAARALCAQDGAELRGRSADSLGDAAAPLSPVNEVRALRMLTGLGALLLARFGTSLAQDAELLQAAAADDVHMALRFRMEKKRLLSSFLQDVAARMKALTQQRVTPSAGAQGQGRREYSTSAGRQKKKKSSSKGFG